MEAAAAPKDAADGEGTAEVTLWVAASPGVGTEAAEDIAGLSVDVVEEVGEEDADRKTKIERSEWWGTKEDVGDGGLSTFSFYLN